MCHYLKPPAKAKKEFGIAMKNGYRKATLINPRPDWSIGTIRDTPGDRRFVFPVRRIWMEFGLANEVFDLHYVRKHGVWRPWRLNFRFVEGEG